MVQIHYLTRIFNLRTVLQEDGDELFEKHVEQWLKLYQQAKINIEGNLQLVIIITI